MKVRYLDLSVQDPQLKEKLLKAVDTVLTHGRIVLGPEVDQFEERVAKACQQEFAVGVNSGSDALYFALRSLDVGPGDEVITTPMSWIATLNAITLCGASPVFVDLSEDMNINPKLIEAAVTSQTKVILPVHWSGKMCDMNAIMEIANRRGIIVIEDAAQAFGASLNGAMAGSFGLVNCLSMNPMKVLCAYGEAGAVTTNGRDLYEKLISLRYAGTVDREDCHYPSLNGRIDTIQAAMLLVNMGYHEEKVARRKAIADYYSETLGEVVICPKETDGYKNVYYTYTIISDERDRLMNHLESKGIETKIHHKILMPYHTAYRHLPRPEIPVAEDFVGRILSIPAHENMSMAQAEYVAISVREFYGA